MTRLLAFLCLCLNTTAATAETNSVDKLSEHLAFFGERYVQCQDQEIILPASNAGNDFPLKISRICLPDNRVTALFKDVEAICDVTFSVTRADETNVLESICHTVTRSDTEMTHKSGEDIKVATVLYEHLCSTAIDGWHFLPSDELGSQDIKEVKLTFEFIDKDGGSLAFQALKAAQDNAVPSISSRELIDLLATEGDGLN